MAVPLRPYLPPVSLIAVGTFYLKFLKSYFFLNGRPITPPPDIKALPLKMTFIVLRLPYLHPAIIEVSLLTCMLFQRGSDKLYRHLAEI